MGGGGGEGEGVFGYTALIILQPAFFCCFGALASGSASLVRIVTPLDDTRKKSERSGRSAVQSDVLST